jgi:hypothetical protein
MTEPKKGLAALGLDNAIRLRWALRDIHAKRLQLSPVSADDLRTLIDMGYVEMKDDGPVITLTGKDEKETGD